jgi:hypothetical protein
LIFEFGLGLWSTSIITASGCAQIPTFFGRNLHYRRVRDIGGSSMPTLVDDDAGEFPLSGREHHE